MKKTHATPTGVPAGLKPSRAIGKGRRGHKKKAPRKEKGKAVDLDTPWSLERRDYYRDGVFASAAASAAAAGDDDDAAQTVGSAFGERGGGQASTSDADGGVIMTLDDLLSSTRTDVIDRLRPHEPWVVARTGAAAAARADLEARRQRGDEQLHFLRALTGWKKKGAGHKLSLALSLSLSFTRPSCRDCHHRWLRRRGRSEAARGRGKSRADRACRELSQATVCNYVSRPMQTLLYQKRLMAALDSVHELRVHDDGHWREVFAQEEAAAAQAQGVTTVATDEEVLLRVEVYHAAKPQLRMQEFMVLGSQRVSELMDRVYCLLDVDVAQPHGVRRHSQPPPRFVYLDGVFYSEVCGDGSAAAPIIRHAALLRREGAAAAEKTEAKEAGKQVALTASQAREAAIVAAASQNQRGVTGLGPSDEGEDALGGDAPGATPTPLTQPSSAETAVEAAAAGSATHTAPQGAVPLPVHPAAAIVGTPSFREQHTGRSNQTRTKLPRGWRPEEALFTAGECGSLFPPPAMRRTRLPDVCVCAARLMARREVSLTAGWRVSAFVARMDRDAVHEGTRRRTRMFYLTTSKRQKLEWRTPC